MASAIAILFTLYPLDISCPKQIKLKGQTFSGARGEMNFCIAAYTSFILGTEHTIGVFPLMP